MADREIATAELAEEARIEADRKALAAALVRLLGTRNQAEVERLAGVPERCISKAKAGLGIPLDHLFRIARAINLEPPRFFRDLGIEMGAEPTPDGYLRCANHEAALDAMRRENARLATKLKATETERDGYAERLRQLAEDEVALLQRAQPANRDRAK